MLFLPQASMLRLFVIEAYASITSGTIIGRLR